MAGADWTAEETRTLISLWGQSHVQAQLDGVAQNRPIYETIAREHADAGYDRTWQQCRTIIKNLQQRYRMCDLPSSPVRAVIPAKPNVVQPQNDS